MKSGRTWSWCTTYVLKGDLKRGKHNGTILIIHQPNPRLETSRWSIGMLLISIPYTYIHIIYLTAVSYVQGLCTLSRIKIHLV